MNHQVSIKLCPFCGETPKVAASKSRGRRICTIKCCHAKVRTSKEVAPYQGNKEACFFAALTQACETWNHRPVENELLKLRSLDLELINRAASTLVESTSSVKQAIDYLQKIILECRQAGE